MFWKILREVFMIYHKGNYYSDFLHNTDAYTQGGGLWLNFIFFVVLFLYITSISQATHNLVGTNGVTLKMIIHIYPLLPHLLTEASRPH